MKVGSASDGQSCTLPFACCRAIPTPIDLGVDVHAADVGGPDHDLTVIPGDMTHRGGICFPRPRHPQEFTIGFGARDRLGGSWGGAFAAWSEKS